MRELVYNGQIINTRDAEMLCLTDMWRAADCPVGKEPWRWSATDAAGQFIDYIKGTHNLARNEVYKAGRGKGGLTFAHWQVGFAYAKYLSHDFHAWCNDVVRQHMEVLAKKDEARQQGKVARKVWASACFSKGCDQRGVADATNATYRTFFNKTAKQLREARGLKKHIPLRDHMRLSTVIAVSLAEALAAETIAIMPNQGNEACIDATQASAAHVKGAVLAARQDQRLIDIQ